MSDPDDLSYMRPRPVPTPRPHAARSAPFDQLLEAACSGASWAFERLFAEHSPRLRAFAAARGADDPDGLVNEVLSEVFSSLPRFSGDETAFRGFVFHVARRRLIDDYRRRSRRPIISGTRLPDRVESAPPDLQPDALIGLQNQHALSMLGSLTDDQRDVLLLRVMCDLSLGETARALDKPITAIKALQRRGIATLKRRIHNGTVSL